MIQKILPLLNRLIPQNLATKGLKKLDPRLGKFLANATSAGYTIDSAMDFLRDQLQPEEQQGLRPDELAANQRIKQSRMPQEAAKIAAGGTTIGALPTVIGSLFEKEEEKLPPKEKERVDALKKFNERSAKRKKEESPLSAASLEEQFRQAQERQMQENEDRKRQEGKAALLQQMQNITNELKRLKGM